jgi:hypothetical protein
MKIKHRELENNTSVLSTFCCLLDCRFEAPAMRRRMK